MPQLNLNGQPEPPPGDEDLWARILRLQRDGFYNAKESAKLLLADGFFSDEWHERVDLAAAIKAIEDAGRGRNPDGTRRAIKIDKPHQYRIWDWATYKEALGDLQHRIALYRNDGESIRVDAGEMIKKFPKHRTSILAVIPKELRPFEK